ncbi:MAG: MFS transporter [Sporocytophaga sp.]|uniref:MFS transporter n=1 Tax=Sporocytophaga sp. TaxID=2231183 RepID=UPI001B18583F|nr:MFS transporter [Sporocytophaga sp.]MBO9698836.1 MFS transporter [Sporocytophaga sp.]
MKNKKALTLLFISNGISGFAQGISMLSIPWYFTQQNQSSLFIAFFGAVTLGSLFWGLYAGALVDGFNRKDVFLGTNFIEGLIILSVASLGFKEGVLPGALIMLVFTITFFGYHIHYPNLYAFAQEITDPKDYTKVTSYIEIVGQSTSIGAAALGALLLEGVDTVQTIPFLNLEIPIHIERWELHEIFLMDGLTYIISFIMILFITHKPSRDITHLEEGDLKEKLKSGYDYLVNNKLVSLFGICSYSIFIVTLVEIFSLRPLYISHHLQEGGDILGLSELLYASGSLVSGIIINTLLSRMPIPRSIVILTFLTALAFFVCSFTQNVIVFLGISMITGFTNAGSRIFRVSYLFNLIPNELTGRVNSMFNVINTVFRMIFIIAFIFPFFSKGSNVVYAYLILGLFTLIAGIVLIFLYKRILRLTERISEVGTLSH